MADLSEFHESEVEALRKLSQRLSKQLHEAKQKHEALVKATYQGAYDAFLLEPWPKSVAPKKDKRSKKAEVALWHMTDWQGAKALADDTPVLTTQGWMTHGELRPGMEVFGPEGKPVKITAVTGSRMVECGEVIFDCGISIVASMDHSWSGWRRYKSWPDNVYSRRGLVWTTQQIADLKPSFRSNRKYNDRSFCIDLPEPLSGPFVDLPIDPYILGVWLGDGNSADGRITVGKDDVGHASQYGRLTKYPSATAWTLFVPELTKKLRWSGLIGNKHVPKKYLHASAEQRLALLQGLMDTDGTVDSRGHCSFTNTRKDLSDAVAFLAVSLGMKVKRSESVGELYGVEKRRVYDVYISSGPVPLFRMERKLRRMRSDWQEITRYRFVQDVVKVGLRPAQCITVDGGLYLAGRDLVITHNCTTSYNSSVMQERVLRFVDKAETITDIQRSDHPVKDCVIMFGGDMVEGLFNFATQAFEIDQTIFGQFVTVSKLLGVVVKRALGIYEHVTVVAEWGNHGRIGSKRDNVPKADNIDRMCYEMARQLLAGEPRLTWQDCVEDIQRVEIGNYRALLMHGDEVGRAGFASPSAWQAAGNRWKAGAYKWDFQDIYLGHYHKVASEPLSNGVGSVYWTGSTESDNRYARDSMAASGEPSQRLHFIDPERGRTTAQYVVWVD